jgi:hypothetical protein
MSISFNELKVNLESNFAVAKVSSKMNHLCKKPITPFGLFPKELWLAICNKFLNDDSKRNIVCQFLFAVRHTFQDNVAKKRTISNSSCGK